MIALADCNNFYASCEKLFNPSIINRPVVVLSNNDGCVIARSAEAKALGIKMGVPAFEIKEVIEKNAIAVYSSNYTLYGDMSRRVMSTLKTYTPLLEIYSIDEAFLYLDGVRDIDNHCLKIKRETSRNTGIPISLGVAPTKTLAKLANKLAKKTKEGVFVLQPEHINTVLADYPIGDVWGIGRQHAQRLEGVGVSTALDFIKLSKEWVYKHLTIVGLRMWEELRGIRRIGPEESKPKKNIATTRSFGKMISDYSQLEEAVATYANSCAGKLRAQNSCCCALMVFVHTNQFREDLAQYARNTIVKLPVPTADSMEMVKHATDGLKRIFKPGYEYKKAGVIVMDIIPASQVQINMFDTTDRHKRARLMQAFDKIVGRFGRTSLAVGTMGTQRKFRLRQEKLSPCYTTDFNNIILVY